MITRTGTPVKKTGETCVKGEVLVRGTLDIQNDSKEIIRQEYTLQTLTFWWNIRCNIITPFP